MDDYEESYWNNLVISPHAHCNPQGSVLESNRIRGSKLMTFAPTEVAGDGILVMAKPRVGTDLVQVRLPTSQGVAASEVFIKPQMTLLEGPSLPSFLTSKWEHQVQEEYYSGYLDGSGTAQLQTPISIISEQNSVMHASPGLGGKPSYDIALSGTSTNTTIGVSTGGLVLSRNLVAGESFTVMARYTDSVSRKLHDTAKIIVGVGTNGSLLNIAETNNTSTAYDKIEIEVSYSLNSPLFVEKFEVYNNSEVVSGNAEIFYNESDLLVGPTEEDILQLHAMTGTRRHAVTGLVLWVVAAPTATDSVTITACTMLKEKAGRLFLNRTQMISQAQTKDLLFVKGRDGAIGLSFPHSVSAYGATPDSVDALDAANDKMSRVYMQLDIGSQDSVRVYIQWGLTVSSEVENRWRPRPSLPYNESARVGIIELCSRVPSVYENRRHKALIKKALEQVAKFATSDSLKSTAGAALKYAPPALMALASML